MDGRANRILIPSAVALIAISATFWAASGGAKGPTDWLGSSAGTLDFLVGAGIVTLGLGYLCSAAFTLRVLTSETCRLGDLSELAKAFGLTIGQNLKGRGRQDVEKRLLDEFHARLHSHAPQSLIDHCTRRNTAWYAAKTSCIASLVGWVFGVTMLGFSSKTAMSCIDVVGAALSFGVFFVLVPLALSWQGTRWNLEFWGVARKWIYWDRQIHKAPDGWFGALPEGVDYLKSDG